MHLLLTAKIHLRIRKEIYYGKLFRRRGLVLLLHGDKDELVPIAYSEKAKERFKNVEYHVIVGQGHSFYDEAGRKVDGMILEFLKNL